MQKATYRTKIIQVVAKIGINVYVIYELIRHYVTMLNELCVYAYIIEFV
jgi:hypothetical protein